MLATFNHSSTLLWIVAKVISAQSEKFLYFSILSSFLIGNFQQWCHQPSTPIGTNLFHPSFSFAFRHSYILIWHDTENESWCCHHNNVRKKANRKVERDRVKKNHVLTISKIRKLFASYSFLLPRMFPLPLFSFSILNPFFPSPLSAYTYEEKKSIELEGKSFCSLVSYVLSSFRNTLSIV